MKVYCQIHFWWCCWIFSQCHYILYFFHHLSKKTHLVLSRFLLIFGSNMHKGLFFKYLCKQWNISIFFTERNLIRYYYFINIYIIYWNGAFMFIKFAFFNFSIINFIIFLFVFIYGFKIFYNHFNLLLSTFFVQISFLK